MPNKGINASVPKKCITVKPPLLLQLNGLVVKLDNRFIGLAGVWGCYTTDTQLVETNTGDCLIRQIFERECTGTLLVI